MTYYDKAKQLLVAVPASRKVEHRATAVYTLLRKFVDNEIPEKIDQKTFEKCWSAMQSFDRAIRDVQEDCPELTDKENEEKKEILRQEKIIKLGYEPGTRTIHT